MRCYGSAFRVLAALSAIVLTAGPAIGKNTYRTIDGSDNHVDAPLTNAAQQPLYRAMPADYGDAISGMSGAGRPGPREISNAVAAQTESIPNPDGLNDLFWQWGQFLDHDIDLTRTAIPVERAPIKVPTGDAYFDSSYSGEAFIAFTRSNHDPGSGSDPANPRQQVNSITGWIDASNVYGSDPERAAALRTFDGRGTLKTSSGNLLPFNEEGLPNEGNGNSFFLAGDVRANEQIGLTAMHVVFMREHNRLAKKLRRKKPRWDGERLYQEARAMVAAEIQIITYEEWLPLLLGANALPRYRRYDPAYEASIANEFSTAAFRFGHSMLNEQVLRLDRRDRPIAAGHLPLAQSFFAPQEIVDYGVEPILRGMSRQRAQRLDIYITDAVRNFLFGQPGAGGFDLAALNIQRGRDHGLPGYNAARTHMGLPPAASFADITSDARMQSRLAAIYAGPNDVDLWVGGLAEDPVDGAQVGELFHRIIAEQFTALMLGDRYFYKTSLTGLQKQMIGNPSLRAIIQRNTSIGRELRRDVFHAQ